MFKTLKHLLLIIFLSHISQISAGIGQLNEQNDYGIWLEQSVKIALNDSWSIRARAQQRWGNDFQKAYYQDYEGVLQYELVQFFNICKENSILQSWTIGPGLRESTQIHTNLVDKRKWVWVARPLISSYLNLEWQGWKLNQRFRGDYHFYQSANNKNFGSFRHRFNLYTPWKVSRFNINPFMSYEYFLRARNQVYSGVYYETRVKLGLAADLNEHIGTEVWWQWKANKHLPGEGRLWVDTYQIGLVLNVLI